MRVVRNDEGEVVGIELTRRNLSSLLAKLDGHPPGSACTISSPKPDNVFVKAVESVEHYRDRPPGAMHPDTEAVNTRLALEYARGYAKALEEYGIQPHI